MKPVIRKRGERGFTLVTMGVCSVALLGALGMAVDVGKTFITKNELQNFCDSAALYAGLWLDGTTTGITNAKSAVTNSTNPWNLATTKVTTTVTPTVEFATASTGPWVTSPSPATGYRFVRVTATISQSVFFVPVVVSNMTTISVKAQSVAGQVDITNFPQGLAPYTAIAVNTTGPNFGLTVGNEYDLQWPQFNATRNGCSDNNPDKCFNQPTCADEPKSSEVKVKNYWASSNNGYWGASSNNTIADEILDLIQLEAVAVGTNIDPVLTNGNKASEAGYLDQRASQDSNYTDNTVSTYLADTHNGRRLLAVPIVNPTDLTTTTVVGYGQFLLYTNGNPSNFYTKDTNGNDPFCAVYAGPYNIGSRSPGVGGSTGASSVKLVQ
jgi:Flp pilus assembly protein TadG